MGRRLVFAIVSSSSLLFSNGINVKKTGKGSLAEKFKFLLTGEVVEPVLGFGGVVLIPSVATRDT